MNFFPNLILFSILIMILILGGCGIPVTPPQSPVKVSVLPGTVAIKVKRWYEIGTVMDWVRKLEDPSPLERKLAAEALGIRKDPRGVEPLLRTMQDPDAGVRAMAAWALGGIQDPRAVDPLLAALKDPDREVRKQAVKALGKWKEARIAAPLQEMLRDPDEEVRRETAAVLAALGEARTVEALIQALGDPNPEVKKQAIISLGKTRDSRAVEALLKALEERDIGLRKQAILALGEIRDSRAVEPLIRLVQNPREIERETAIKALGMIGDPRALKPLFEALKEREKEICSAADYALRNLKPGGAAEVEFLILKLREQNVLARKMALSLLKKLDAPELVDRLITTTKNEENKEVKKWLARVLDDFSAKPNVKEYLDAAIRENDYPVLAGAFRYYLKLSKSNSEILHHLIEALNRYHDAEIVYHFIHEDSRLKINNAGRACAIRNFYVYLFHKIAEERSFLCPVYDRVYYNILMNDYTIARDCKHIYNLLTRDYYPDFHAVAVTE